MDDQSIMPFGKHQGKSLQNVPADYLLWLLDTDWCREKFPELIAYIRSNKDCLETDAEEERQSRGYTEDLLED